MSEFKLNVSNNEYSAISDIFGPPSSVHYLVMCAALTDTGWVLSGDEKAFSDLDNIIEEELCEGMAKKRNQRYLCSVQDKIEKNILKNFSDWN